MNDVVAASLGRLRGSLQKGAYVDVLREAKALYTLGQENEDHDAYRLSCKYLADTYFVMGDEEHSFYWGSKLIEQLDYEFNQFRFSAYQFLYMVFAHLEDYEKAIEVFNELITWDKNHVNERQMFELYVNHVNVTSKAGYFEDAFGLVETCRMLLNKLPEIRINGELYILFNLIQTYILQGNQYEAQQYIGRIQREYGQYIVNQNQLYVDEIMFIYYEAFGTYSEAIEAAIRCYKKAVSMDNHRYRMLMLKKIVIIAKKMGKEESYISYIETYEQLCEDERINRIKERTEQLYDAYSRYKSRKPKNITRSIKLTNNPMNNSGLI